MRPLLLDDIRGFSAKRLPWSRLGPQEASRYAFGKQAPSYEKMSQPVRRTCSPRSVDPDIDLARHEM